MEGKERRGEERTGQEGKKRQKEGKKEEKRGKGRRENYSNSFSLAFPPGSQMAAPPNNGPRGCCSLGPAVHCWLFLLTVFGFHKGHCSPFGFSDPDVRQDLLVNVPYPSKDQSIIFKQRCLKTPE